VRPLPLLLSVGVSRSSRPTTDASSSSRAGLLPLQEARRRLHPVRPLPHLPPPPRSNQLTPSPSFRNRCANRSCYTAFHVTCAREHGLSLKMRQGSAATGELRAYCDRHGEVRARSSSFSARPLSLARRAGSLIQAKERLADDPASRGGAPQGRPVVGVEPRPARLGHVAQPEPARPRRLVGVSLGFDLDRARTCACAYRRRRRARAVAPQAHVQAPGRPRRRELEHHRRGCTTSSSSSRRHQVCARVPADLLARAARRAAQARRAHRRVPLGVALVVLVSRFGPGRGRDQARQQEGGRQRRVPVLEPQARGEEGRAAAQADPPRGASGAPSSPALPRLRCVPSHPD